MQGRLQIEVVKIAMTFFKSSNETLPFVVLWAMNAAVGLCL